MQSKQKFNFKELKFCVTETSVNFLAEVPKDNWIPTASCNHGSFNQTQAVDSYLPLQNGAIQNFWHSCGGPTNDWFQVDFQVPTHVFRVVLFDR